MFIDPRLKCAVDCRELAAENKRLVQKNEGLQVDVERRQTHNGEITALRQTGIQLLVEMALHTVALEAEAELLTVRLRTRDAEVTAIEVERNNLLAENIQKAQQVVRLEADVELLRAEVLRLKGLAIAHAPPEQVSYYEYQTCGLCGGSGKASAEITLLRCTLCRGEGKVLMPAIAPPIGLSATSDTKEPRP